ncbi:Lrp/AsnC family transcriptional regulator [Salinicola aestuarinus]|uniref:Lrp/AsnC family transcriptional regulator n=1 Tax=Salinicola aestuarinus TaxID=1949082 RepID=UPI000DA15358|nr:Lrp/AsnC family transcriptional regulator [Salinicola aestuarinus]
MKLDRTDLRILTELQKNGRITNVELAELVHLSPSPCLMRVKKLQTAGYIAGYAALIDLAKFDEIVTVFTEVTLSSHHQIDFDRFQQAVEKVEECVECHLVSGGFDYLLKFVTRGIAEYQALIENLVEQNLGIEKYFNYIVIKSPLASPHLPLNRLFTPATE